MSIPEFTRNFINKHLDECLSKSKNEIIEWYNKYVRERINKRRETVDGK